MSAMVVSSQRRDLSPGEGEDSMGGSPDPRNWLRRSLRQRPALVVGVVLLAVLVPGAGTALRAKGSSPDLLRAGGPSRATQGDATPASKPMAVTARRDKLPKPTVSSKPTVLHLKKAHSAVFDVRALKGKVVKRERPERAAPGEPRTDPDAALPATVNPST